MNLFLLTVQLNTFHHGKGVWVTEIVFPTSEWSDWDQPYCGAGVDDGLGVLKSLTVSDTRGSPSSVSSWSHLDYCRKCKSLSSLSSCNLYIQLLHMIHLVRSGLDEFTTQDCEQADLTASSCPSSVQTRITSVGFLLMRSPIGWRKGCCLGLNCVLRLSMTIISAREERLLTCRH